MRNTVIALCFALYLLPNVQGFNIEYMDTFTLQEIGIDIDPGSSDDVATDIIVSGTTGYLIIPYHLVVLDLIDISHPQSVATLPLPYYCIRLTRKDDAMLAACCSQAVTFISVSNPRSPFIISTMKTKGEVRDIEFSGHMAYIASGTEGLLCADISSITSPVILSTIREYGEVSSSLKVNNFLYCGFYNANTHTSNLGVFSATSEIPAFVNLFSLWISELGLFKSSTLVTRDLIFIDISTQDSPKRLETPNLELEWGGETTDMDIDNECVYVIGATWILDHGSVDWVYMIGGTESDPSVLAQWLRYDGSAQFSGICKNDDFIYIADGYLGLTILRVEEDSAVEENHWCLYE